GLCIAIPGPTLLDLQEQTNTDTEQISRLFTGRSVGYLFGSLMGGFLFDRVNQTCLLSLSLLLTAIGTAAAPWCTNFLFLVGILAFQGISMGFLDTGGNVLCLYIWGRGSGPYMQAMHFVFGLGAFVAPLLAEPFLSRTNSTNITDSTLDMIRFKFKQVARTVTSVFSSFTKVQFAYLVIAAFVLMVSLMFMLHCCCCGRCSCVAVKYHDSGVNYKIKKESPGFRVQILILLFVFYFFYVGMEVTYGGLVMSFAVNYLGWSKSSGTLVNSVFWGSFAAGRLLAIPLSKCLTPAVMIVADLVLTIFALAGLVIMLNTNHIMLWFCTATLGIGLASIFPTGITWAERYMQVTGKSTAVFVVGSALGEMLLPLVTGFLFQNKGPMWLMYLMMGCAFLSMIVYIIMQNLAS
ncbi:hypothetical protein CAPTEDRAFT_82130, partial [Capitella teleta]